MKILLTNDDGVVSSGIRVLANMLSEKALLGAIIAPDRERSGAGHSITVDRPIRTHPLDPGMFPQDVTCYSCDGTPTDCVNLGLDLLFPHTDFVVAGINQGANMGDDMTYSGTVCAALESVILGRPAMAVSLACGSTGFRHNTTAALVAMAVLEHIEQHPLPAGTFLNVNVPNLLFPQLKGFKITRRGIRRYKDKFMTIKDPSGTDRYWIGGTPEEGTEEGTDVAAVAAGFVSVTPVQVDMTDYRVIDEMTASGVADQLSAHLTNAGA